MARHIGSTHPKMTSTRDRYYFVVVRPVPLEVRGRTGTDRSWSEGIFFSRFPFPICLVGPRPDPPSRVEACSLK